MEPQQAGKYFSKVASSRRTFNCWTAHVCMCVCLRGGACMSQLYSENRKPVDSMSIEIKPVTHSSALPACSLLSQS